MRMDMLKSEINRLMETIIDNSPENMPIKKIAINKLFDTLSESKWVEKQVKERGLIPTNGRNDMFEECVQECYLSILTKCADYDPGKNAQPMTYLTNILSYTVQDFKKRAMNPGASEHYANLANKVRNTLSALKEEGYVQPTTEMIATFTGISIQQAEEALTVIRSSSGYDSFILLPDANKPGLHDDTSAHPVFIGDTPLMHDPADYMVEMMEREAIQKELKKIGGTELEAFLLYYGYGDYENAGCAFSCQKVARHIGNISAKEAKKMIEGVKNQLVKNVVCRELYGADDQ